MNTIDTPGRMILYGVGSSFLVDVEATLARLDLTVAVYVDNSDSSDSFPGPTVTPSQLTADQRALPCVVPLVTPGHRQAIVAELDDLGITHRPAVLDPTTPMAASVMVAEGVFVNAGGVIGGEVQLERFVLVNRGTSIGHHSVLEAFSTVGPGVTIPAAVLIESGAFIGAGAVLAPSVRVGRNSVVGAGAVVVRDVEPNTVVVGNPAKVIRRDVVGYNEVAVT